MYRRLRRAGHVARLKRFQILTAKLTGKIPLERCRFRWEDSIRMDLKELDINTRNWTESANDRDYWRTLANAALNFGFHKPWSQL